MLMIFIKSWQDALNDGLDIFVVALDIAGDLDRVWASLKNLVKRASNVTSFSF